jgi:NADPH:quinone reductase-like Zn-dependent oxidoreductase
MSDLFGIEGSHVLVTGGSSGLGRFLRFFLRLGTIASYGLANFIETKVLIP